jgi:hypothetical protein
VPIPRVIAHNYLEDAVSWIGEFPEEQSGPKVELTHSNMRLTQNLFALLTLAAQQAASWPIDSALIPAAYAILIQIWFMPIRYSSYETIVRN